MSRVLDIADLFTSATTPTISGGAVAAAASLTFTTTDDSANTYLAGNNDGTETFAQLTELNQLRETTRFS